MRTRRPAAGRTERGGRRIRPDPDRAGDRVRLLHGAGGARAARGRHRLDHDQLQPGDGSTDFDASDRLYFEPLDAEASTRCCATSQRRTRSRSACRSSCSLVVRRQSTWPSRLRDRGVPILGSQRRLDRPGRGSRTFRGISARTSGFRSRPERRSRRWTTPRPVAEPHRLSGAGAPVLRAGRSGDGGRLWRGPSRALHPQRRRHDGRITRC